MYEYIKGIFEEQETGYVVVDHMGMGYRIYISATTMNELPKIGQDLRLMLHPVYKEDDISLYGFATTDERDIFRTIIGISGIGPKVAMGLLSQFSRDDLIRHIVNEDAKAIAKAPGIGKKTAERVILELKDKYKNYKLGDAAAGAVENLRSEDNCFNEAVNGLLGLGYSYAEASVLVEGIMKPGMTIEDILKKALMSANPLG